MPQTKTHAWAAESFPELVQLENSGGEALPGAKSAVRKASPSTADLAQVDEGKKKGTFSLFFNRACLN
jgi:hypothetical protein